MQGVILTMSGKYGGYCVAVYDIRQNRIVRLVWDESGGSVPYAVMKRFRPLDAAEFIVGKPVPNQNHTENVLWEGRWKRLPRVKMSMAEIYAQLHAEPSSGLVFGNAEPRLTSISHLNHSLQIYRVQNLLLHHAEGSRSGKADFILNGVIHKNYSVTDFQYYDFWKNGENTRLIGEAFLVISLPVEPFIVEGNRNLGYYKFIAAIYPINT